MGIAEFIIGRAFARPVGSTHPTRYALRRDNAAKESPHPDAGVEIGRDGAIVRSLDRRRRTDEGKLRL